MKIQNEVELKNFLSRCGPLLKEDEVLIYFVFVRKKYCPEVKNHHQMVFRDIIRNGNIEGIINRIKNIPNIFLNYDTLKSYNPECYSLYLDLNPKSCLKAYMLFTKQMNDLLYQAIKDPYRKYEFNMIKKKLMSSIHKSNSRQPYILVDIDIKDIEFMKNIISDIEEKPVWISETHGGYHLIYNKTSRVCKYLYQEIRVNLQKHIKDKTIEIQSEVMTPLPGILQGGHEVKEVKL